MTAGRCGATLAGFVLLLGATALAGDNGRLYGRIKTVDGDTYQGYIRWDKNEVSWVDILNGDKQLPDEATRSEASRRRGSNRTRIEIFGIKIGNVETSDWSGSAQSGLRMGHIKSITKIDDETALVETKSGEKVELSGGSTDLGSDMRELIIEDEKQGETELSWDDLDRVDFEAAPTNDRSSFGDRLYGTLTTRRGDQYTGFVGWDIDEVLTNDVLDGEDHGRARKVKFEKIASISRYSSSASSVKFKTGDEVVLRGSNDVDSDNRGILVCDPGFGQVTVNWDEFASLDLSQAPSAVTYASFDGGRPLHGTVYTEDGDSYTGTVRWDNDEQYTWELLNGSYHDASFDIELGLVKEIARVSTRGSKVTLWDGRSFELRGSNDVDEDNKGIFITPDRGKEIEVPWEDFKRVEFDRR